MGYIFLKKNMFFSKTVFLFFFFFYLKIILISPFSARMCRKGQKKAKTAIFFEESQTRPKKPDKRPKRQKMPDDFQNAKFP
jgi:hypothetical protein